MLEPKSSQLLHSRGDPARDRLQGRFDLGVRASQHGERRPDTPRPRAPDRLEDDDRAEGEHHGASDHDPPPAATAC
jgi:hypothetical protein